MRRDCINKCLVTLHNLLWQSYGETVRPTRYKKREDLLLPRSYTRLSCSFKKWNLQLAKIKISPIHPHYPISFPPTWLMNESISDVNVSNKNRQQLFPCHNIHVYSISIDKSVEIKRTPQRERERETERERGGKT